MIKASLKMEATSIIRRIAQSGAATGNGGAYPYEQLEETMDPLVA